MSESVSGKPKKDTDHRICPRSSGSANTVAGQVAVAMAVVLAFVASSAWADAPYTLAWSREISTDLFDYCFSMAADGQGNTYITGATSGSLFGLDPGRMYDFLAKYDAAGDLLWSRPIDADCGSVTVDGQGNAYIAGSVYDEGDDPEMRDQDAFVSKYDPSGNVLWTRQIDTDALESGGPVAVDDQGNVYMTGQTAGSLFGPTAGDTDAFLSKYDPSGNILWSRQIGTDMGDSGSSVTVDGQNKVYVTGRTRGHLFGPNAGFSDIFLARYAGDGTFLWGQQMGTGGDDIAGSVAADGSANPYIAGYVMINPSGPEVNIDAFLIKFQPSVPVAVEGTILSTGYAGDYTLLPARLHFTSVNGGDNFTRTVTLNADGTFRVDGITQGTYTLVVEAPYCLSKRVDTVRVLADPTVLAAPLELQPADANGDNTISFEDFALLQNGYGRSGTAAEPFSSVAAVGRLGGCGLPGIVLVSVLVMAFSAVRVQQSA